MCTSESCIVDQARFNTKINILYMLDAFFADEYRSQVAEVSVYHALVLRDLPVLVDMVVPKDSWEAVLNYGSARQILCSWRMRNVLNPEMLTTLLETMEQRSSEYAVADSVRERVQKGDLTVEHISRGDILRRIEEDRERHKQLREESWKLPPMTYMRDLAPENPVPASIETTTGQNTQNAPDAITLEFEQTWETTSDLNDDDMDVIREEISHWWGAEAVKQ